MIFPHLLAVCIFLSLTGNVTSFSLYTRNSLKGKLPSNVETSFKKSHGRERFRLASTSSSTNISTSSSSSSSTSTSSSTTISTNTSTSVQEKIKFERLSTNPLLFSSQNPVLSREECQTLSSWCQSTIQARGGEGNLNNNVLLQGIANQEEGALLLKRLQQTLHSDLLGFDEDLEEMVIPRYISYDEDEYGADMNMNVNANASSSSDKYGKAIQNYKVEDILPDGLHVDTNNSKFSRHWTILFYLDTCDTLGATSFPLAEVSHATNVDFSLHVDEERDRMQMQRVAASKLIFEEDIQHTKFEEATQDQLSIMKFVDESGLDMIQRQASENVRVGQMEMGLRILPRHGHFCLFSGLSDDGYGNPLSFHGAEAMYPGETKAVLTFFYEIPMGTFGSRAELGERAKEREEKFFKFHNIKMDE